MFYVIGSTKEFGPIGYEAFPFNSLKDAEDFSIENGGTAINFDNVTIFKMVPQWKYYSNEDNSFHLIILL